jgi:muramidase (phage lysozyme)
MDAIGLIAALEHQNVRAFLQMLRLGEGTRGEDGYRTLYGGGLFDSFADHPRRKVTAGKWTSTAAGVGQILERTWDGLVRQYGFADFSPKNQDLACVALIKGRKALDDVIAGRFEAAVMKCNKEWASLPGSPYGQPTVTLEQARAEYVAHGGSFEGAEPIPPNPFTTQEPAMAPVLALAPFLKPALFAVIQAVPELVRMFGSGGEITERNAKAADVAVAIAKDAIGAKNEQELVETLQADPQAAATVRQAVQDNWFKLEEVGGGIQVAREANLKVQGDRSFLFNPAVWISVLLLALPFMLAVDVFYVHPDKYTSEIKTQVVTAFLAILTVVAGYWLGSSSSSKAKDDALLRR